MNLSIRRLKSLNTRRGLTWTCDLYDGDKKIADVDDRGDGSGVTINFSCLGERAYDGPTAERLEAYAESIGETGESIVARLADELDFRQKLARRCKKSTVYRLPSMPDDEWRVLSLPWSPRARELVEKKHPGESIRFANEELA